MADLLERLLAHATGGDTAHDAGHARRVWRHCQDIAEGEGLPADRALMAAAALHDLVSLPKDHPERSTASRLSAKAARNILRAEQFDEAEIEAACHAIEAHSFSAGIAPQTETARILQDADRIEALGAIGLARVFAVSGALDRALWHPTDPMAEKRDPDDSLWAVDHFTVKLLRLPAKMNTKTGRRIAEERAGVLKRYLTALEKELSEA